MFETSLRKNIQVAMAHYKKRLYYISCTYLRHNFQFNNILYNSYVKSGNEFFQTSQSSVDQPTNDVSEKEKLSIIFTLKNQVGGLVRALQAFQDLGINVTHIESRPSQTGANQADFLVDIECEPRKVRIRAL